MLSRSKTIILLVLFFFCGLSVHSQEKQYSFTWLSDPDHKKAGELLIEYSRLDKQNEFKLSFSVNWYNEQGLKLNMGNGIPYLYLSYIGLEIRPTKTIECKTFLQRIDGQVVYQIFFQEKSELVFNTLGKISSDVIIGLTFQYAFTESDIQNGKTYPVNLPTGTNIQLTIPKEFFAPEQPDTETIKDDPALWVIKKKCEEADSCISEIIQARDRLNRVNDSLALEVTLVSLNRSIADLQQDDSTQRAAISNELQIKHFESDRLIIAIDSVLPKIREASVLVNADPIPKDSSDYYSRTLENISLEIRSLKITLIDYRYQIRDLLNNLGVETKPADLESRRKVITDRYLPVFQYQLDSVTRILKNHNVLLLDLEPELFQPPSRAIDNIKLDSLQEFHIMLKNQLAIVYGKHQQSYMQYLNQITGLGPVAVLETKHNQFEETYSIADQTIRKTDKQITDLRKKVDKIISRDNYKVLWYGGSGLLILIVLIIVQQILRSRKRAIGVHPYNNHKTRHEISGTDGLLDEFDAISNSPSDIYPFIPGKMTDQVVAEVQFTFRAIKTISQLVSGAISRRAPLDFGGYLFGRQYKAIGKNVGQSILLVEQVISSSAIRSDLNGGIEGSEDFVDELDRIVSQNRKSVLIGWITAVSDESLTMPEDLIKIHRTFFREKWQIAILVNPGTDNLKSGIFLRRKSGFFEPLPVEENCFSLEEFYQYALHPPIASSGKKDKRPDPEGYISVELNQNWCDSIVQRVFILPDILINMQKDRVVEQVGLTSNLASGFFYGIVEALDSDDNDVEYEVFINRFVEVVNGDMPRKIPGSELIGWLHLGNTEVYETLREAIPFHEKYFTDPYQICVLVNTSSSELRIFSRKHSLEMNNNIIETEELNLIELVLSARKALRK